MTTGAAVADVHVELRVLVTTLALTPVMTYLLLPWITARLQWWLQGWRLATGGGPQLPGLTAVPRSCSASSAW